MKAILARLALPSAPPSAPPPSRFVSPDVLDDERFQSLRGQHRARGASPWRTTRPGTDRIGGTAWLGRSRRGLHSAGRAGHTKWWERHGSHPSSSGKGREIKHP